MEQGTPIEEVKIRSNWNVGKIRKDKAYSWNELFEFYEELYSEYEELEEELEKIEEDLKENFKPIPVSEQVGISDRDFI